MNNDIESLWNAFYAQAQLAGKHPTIIAQYRMVYMTAIGQFMNMQTALAATLNTYQRETKFRLWTREINAILAEFKRSPS